MELAQSQRVEGQIGHLMKNNDVIMAVAVVGILMIMIIPLPAFLLDLLLSFNITSALIILLVGMYIRRPLELSAFPSILLLATVFRLSLNIASTRMILLHGSEGSLAAGKLIKAFGGFVVGGNYLVGLIVFIILVVINFIVITKGAGRIAEVAARFTLDALPGKQMSIDADLNAGLIDDREAKARRQEIALEAEYYGAMDGANKFVRGDAIAGIIITLINIIAGLAIGVFSNGMGLSTAAETYTLLTIGDGLVTQIPALLVSTAAGLIVSRAGAEASLGREITAQILFQPRAIGIAAAVLFGFALVPGLPTFPFMVLASLAAATALTLLRAERQAADKPAEPQIEEQKPAGEDVSLLPPVDPLALQVGYGLIPLVDVEQDGELLERIKAIRRQIAQEAGILVPSVHIQDNSQLKPGEYVIQLKGNEVARGELMINYYLAMHPEGEAHTVAGQPTREPTYGLPAIWIKAGEKEKALADGYTVVDLATVLTTHLSDVIRRHACEYMGRQEIQQMLDHLKQTHPKVVEELVPNLLPLGGVVRVLQNLLREQIPIRDLLTILETLADWASMTKDVDVLTEHVRHALARTITKLYQNAEAELPLLTLAPQAEEALAEAIQHTEQGSFVAMEPGKVQQIMKDIAGKLERFAPFNAQPAVLCSAQIRAHFKKLTDRYLPDLVVLSYNDILSDAKIKSLGTAGGFNAD